MTLARIRRPLQYFPRFQTQPRQCDHVPVEVVVSVQSGLTVIPMVDHALVDGHDEV